VQIHDKVDHFEFEIPSNVVGNEFSRIDNFDVGAVGFVNGNVDGHVLLSSFAKILERVLFLHATIIRRGQFNFFNIFFQQFRRIANAFHKHLFGTNAGLFERFEYVSTSFSRGIGGIKDCHSYSILF
jgi:hypothetical protein